ncbi:MAG: GNAT family N-acetyltransferase [Ruminococcaceae bacterium]|nr:GNAT family N-acetyltransferase [Oscillospiraceae bacterium]
MYTIAGERLTAAEYIDFLKRTDLGSQYPRERFEERIGRLVASVPVSLTARDETGALIGVLFGVTDFAYWLFVTDLGVARDRTGQGVGRALMTEAIRQAGGEKDILVYLKAAAAAVPFYEKLGFDHARDVMVYDRIDWTDFTVQ